MKSSDSSHNQVGEIYWKGDMALAGMACISSIESKIKAADPGTLLGGRRRGGLWRAPSVVPGCFASPKSGLVRAWLSKQ